MGCICMKKRGIGMASIFYGTGYGNGFPDVATAVVEVHDDGSATVLTGAADCGQGSNTTLAQIAAAELGIELHKVTLISADTDCTPDTGTTAATRQTYSSGNAVRLAVAKAKQKILQHAAKILKVNTIDGLILQDNHVYVKTYPKVNLPLEQVVSAARFAGERMVAEASFTAHSTTLDPETGQGAPYTPYAFGTQIAEVEVDTETGKVDVLNIIASHDIGRAINKVGVEGQIQGGVAQGLGWALTEEIVLEQGRIKNGNFTEYLIPTALDTPEVTPLFIESFEQTGPFGAKGLGEPALLPTMPAILNAIYDAVGVRITELPASPEKILQAIKEKTVNHQ